MLSLRLRLILLIFALFGVDEVRADPVTSTVAGPLGHQADEYVTRLERFGFSGVVLLARDGQVVLSKGYGLSDREKNLPVTAETVFPIGSITKQFTAAAILKLEMEGKLSVTDLLSKHLPGVPADKAKITLHHLLTHSAGLESDFGDDFEPISREELVRRALASKLRSEPGQRYHYANAGYSLLGAVTERVSGQGYEAYLHDRLFVPAAMTRTGYQIPRWGKDEVAIGYLSGRRWGTILERPWLADGPGWNLRCNGGIHSTCGDMYRWHQALLGDRILSAEAKQKMFTPHMREAGEGSSYGYGWSVARTPRGTRLIGHNGGDGIYFAEFRRYVDENLVVFVASNNSEASGIRVSLWLSRLIFGGDYPTPPTVTSVAAQALAKYCGDYEFPDHLRLHVTSRAGGLFIKADGPEASALLAGGGPMDPKKLHDTAARTLTVAQGQLKGDYLPLHQAFGGRMQLARLTQMQRQRRRDLEAEIGTLQSVEMLATVPRGDRTESSVSFRGNRGAQVITYVWQGSRLNALLLSDSAPAVGQQFYRESDNHFAAFDFTSAHVAHAQFVPNTTGAIVTMQLGPGGTSPTGKHVNP